MQMTVMIEEDYSQKKFAGYIPELRIGAVGDTEEELMENLQDLVQMELDRGSRTPSHLFRIQTMNIPAFKGGE
ncbi:type II toxin-antitoxin system HicB family antitoxin [Paenibacillus alvei]|uniref:type II toxin-antitoxin system HicB family antitoxin n=1 Tax=Paenibacillus alvei TaxID=44250 RepID=UPI00228055BA|nr:type II toxin-antitoxin system HicB family antitoxin [Paenibacillus alvei]MCY9732158.1 type II toxin-antitoxin system HicB family antitoxin [Paenibacillus alvei]MCY9758320.1 type II toxin-antitoxin system HicB family antitoxin [Paenibacillus alvei]